LILLIVRLVAARKRKDREIGRGFRLAQWKLRH